MILIFGGVHQGKLDYALERFGLTRDDVHFCGDEDISMPGGKRLVCGLDKWILALVRADKDVSQQVREFAQSHAQAIVTCDDISCGVVPIDPELRKWREAVGRALGVLASGSDEVIRVFCSIPTRIK